MNHHRHRGWLSRLAIVLLLVLLLLLVGGCAAPLFGTDQQDSNEQATPEASSDRNGTPKKESAASTDSEVEDMEIEPEDILEGGADPKENVTQAPSSKDDTLKNPEEDPEEEQPNKEQPAAKR